MLKGKGKNAKTPVLIPYMAIDQWPPLRLALLKGEQHKKPVFIPYGNWPPLRLALLKGDNTKNRFLNRRLCELSTFAGLLCWKGKNTKNRFSIIYMGIEHLCDSVLRAPCLWIHFPRGDSQERNINPQERKLVCPDFSTNQNCALFLREKLLFFPRLKGQ